MKNKLFVISILITIFIFGIGVYFTVSFNRGTNPKIQNDKSESIDSKTKITGNTNIKSVSPLTNEDFIIKDKNNYIELGGKYGDLKTNEKITETIPCNEKHLYYIYVFENFKIRTGACGGYIGSIDLETPIIQTSRGIIIGDTISEVIKKYGKADDSNIADSIAPGQYVYRYNGNFLTFFVDKIGNVIGIRFESV